MSGRNKALPKTLDLSELAKIASSSSRDDDLHVFMQGDGTCDVQVTDALRKLAGMPVSAILSRPRATTLWQTPLTHPPRLPSTPGRPDLDFASLYSKNGIRKDSVCNSTSRATGRSVVAAAQQSGHLRAACDQVSAHRRDPHATRFTERRHTGEQRQHGG